MKAQTQKILITLFIAVCFAGCKGTENNIVEPVEDYGTISAKVDGAVWSGAYCFGIAGGSAGKTILVIKGKATDKTVKGEDIITITLDTFTGVGEYSIFGKAFGAINMVYKGTEYIYDVGTGTQPVIKITESTSAESILKPGKVVGEFSGTLTNKPTGKSINVTSGTFTAKRAL